MVKLVYFAWVRERMGMAEEMVELPPSILTIADLALWLAGRGHAAARAIAVGHASAFVARGGNGACT